jgi:hypothetical protein
MDSDKTCREVLRYLFYLLPASYENIRMSGISFEPSESEEIEKVFGRNSAG